MTILKTLFYGNFEILIHNVGIVRLFVFIKSLINEYVLMIIEAWCTEVSSAKNKTLVFNSKKKRTGASCHVRCIDLTNNGIGYNNTVSRKCITQKCVVV